MLTTAFAQAGWQTTPPIDIQDEIAFDLLNPLFRAVVIGLLLEGRVALLHMGPPCSSFSMAVNRFPQHAMRSRAEPLGFTHLQPHQQTKVDLGNALADVCVQLAAAQEAAKGFWQAEQPESSLMFFIPSWVKLQSSAFRATRHVCMDGAPWKKPTSLLSNHWCIHQLQCRCDNSHAHITLEGYAPCGRNWTAIASPYWPAFAAKIVCCWSHLLNQEQTEIHHAAAHHSGLSLSSPG